MKMRMSFVFATAFLISSCCFAQELPGPGNPDSVHSSARVLIVLGKVSSDARTLLTDLDSEWKVTNASVLKGYEDRLVQVRCYIDAEKNQLRILSVKKTGDQTANATRYADSAFRR